MKKNFVKAAAALMLMTAMVFTGCHKESENTEPEVPQGTLPEGMYVGIIGFNNELHIKDIKLINSSNANEAKSFIDGLTMGDATLLYHAVNTSIDGLQSAGIPKSLENVYILTFTDGLDKGSYALSSFSSGAEYLNSVYGRIHNEKVAGKPIEAYTVGFAGTDISSYEQGDFTNNMKKLATDDAHVFEVADMAAVSVVFDSIAHSLKSKSENAVLKLHFPKVEPNTKVRFTFDVTNADPAAAAASHCYIEGTYINDSGNNGVLTNVQYVGLGSSSGTTVSSVSNGIYADFTFENMVDQNGQPITNALVSKTREWDWVTAGGVWRHNSEFSSAENTSVTHTYTSAMVMLNIDCSISLGNATFYSLKNAAKNFINVLVSE